METFFENVSAVKYLPYKSGYEDQRLCRRQWPRGDSENTLGANLAYMAGNAGNGIEVPQPVGVFISTGAQMLTPEVKPEVAQNPGTLTPIAQLGDKLDQIGKDTNFRGLTIFDNVRYYTTGSGGNGINPSTSSMPPSRCARTLMA